MKSIIAVIVASFALIACGKKEEAKPVEAAPAVAAPAPVAAPAATPASEPAKTEEAKK